MEHKYTRPKKRIKKTSTPSTPSRWTNLMLNWHRLESLAEPWRYCDGSMYAYSRASIYAICVFIYWCAVFILIIRVDWKFSESDNTYNAPRKWQLKYRTNDFIHAILSFRIGFCGFHAWIQIHTRPLHNTEEVYKTTEVYGTWNMLTLHMIGETEKSNGDEKNYYLIT